MSLLNGLDLKKTEQQIRALCRRWNCPEQDRNDVVQEAFLILLQTGGKVSTAASRAMRQVCGRGEDALQYVDSLNNIPDPVDMQGMRQEVADAVETLSGEQWQIIKWRDEGYTLKEIGAKLGITSERVRQRIQGKAYQDSNTEHKEKLKKSRISLEKVPSKSHI